MRNAIKFAAALGVVFAWACGSEPTTAPPSSRPQAAISDGAHGGGNQHFYFLPPMVPAPLYTGEFDATLSPTVHITVDGDPLATFSATWDGVNPWYQVNWHTGQYTLDPARTYRITVKIGAYALGFADVDLVANGRELRNVNTDESIPLLDGRTLPIKFRIERGAVQNPSGVLLVEYGPYAGQTHVLLRADGSGSTVLPVFGLYEADLSPDGRQLVYSRNFQFALWKSNIDGSGEVQLMSGAWAQSPRWSRDGTRIVWTHQPGPADFREVARINADGSDFRQLTSNQSWDEVAQWSPDMSLIVFHSNRDGPFDIYTMNAEDGSGVTRLTNGLAAGDPEYSPDGSMIAFFAWEGSTGAVYLMNADGSNQRAITRDPCLDYGETGVHFSPDGRWLAFAACYGAPLRDVFLIRLDGTGLTRLTDTPTVDEYVRSWR